MLRVFRMQGHTCNYSIKAEAAVSSMRFDTARLIYVHVTVQVPLYTSNEHVHTEVIPALLVTA